MRVSSDGWAAATLSAAVVAVAAAFSARSPLNSVCNRCSDGRLLLVVDHVSYAAVGLLTLSLDPDAQEELQWVPELMVVALD